MRKEDSYLSSGGRSLRSRLGFRCCGCEVEAGGDDTREAGVYDHSKSSRRRRPETERDDRDWSASVWVRTEFSMTVGQVQQARLPLCFSRIFGLVSVFGPYLVRRRWAVDTPGWRIYWRSVAFRVLPKRLEYYYSNSNRLVYRFVIFVFLESQKNRIQLFCI